MKTALDRLLEKIESIPGIDCWVWTGAAKPTGYGNFFMHGKTMSAHRASYVLHVGEIEDSMVVCHKCDNPSCVNPDHLFVSTQSGNMADMNAKGRRVTADKYGPMNPMFGRKHSSESRKKQAAEMTGKYARERHPRASITQETADAIKAMKNTMTAKQAALCADVSFHVVRNIWRGKSW